MALKTLFKFGVPFSFLYCTIYQQNIWREGNERLAEEQRRVWRDFFTLIDNGYHVTLSKLNLTAPNSSFVAKFDSLDMKKCWNSKVLNIFTSVDQVASNPKIIACKVYRKIQPYISSSEPKEVKEVTEVKTT